MLISLKQTAIISCKKYKRSCEMHRDDDVKVLATCMYVHLGDSEN